VQQYREDEVEQAYAIIIREGLREEIVLDGLVLVPDLPAAAIAPTERLRIVWSGRFIANTAVPSPFVDGIQESYRM
jgi:hypothetical protein